MEQIIWRETDHTNNDFKTLCNELDHYLNQAIGGESRREKYKKFNHLDTMDYVLIACHGEKAIGCGALRAFSQKEIEVKRVFVQEAYRRNYIGSELLERLISKAKTWGYERILLETGDFLKSSLRLYYRHGFEHIPNYGAYKDMPESLCMALSIKSGAVTVCLGKWIKPEQLRELFESVGWLSANYAQRMSKAFQKAGTVLSAWQGDRLIGLVEVLDDGELNAYIHYLLIHPSYQGKGIGTALLRKVKEIYRDYLYLVVVCEKEETVPFYERLGFDTVSGTAVLQIRTL